LGLISWFKKEQNISFEEESGTVCLLIDFENLAISFEEKSSYLLNMQSILDLAIERSNSRKIAVARAYADWRYFSKHADGLVRLGIQTIQAPSHRHQGKNATDIQMAVEATDLMNRRKNLEIFVLVTGDSDFNPLINLLHERGKKVIGIGVDGAVSPFLENVCDEFYFYEDICGDVENKSTKKRIEKKSPPKPLKVKNGGYSKKAPAPRKSEKFEAVKAPPKKQTIIPGSSENNAIDILGLDIDFRFTSSRLKELIPLAAELAKQIDSSKASGFKKMLSLRFPGKINTRESSILAHYLQKLDALHPRGKRGWLHAENMDSESGFDMLLAATQEKLKEAAWVDSRDILKISQLIFSDKMDRAELSMRASRGLKLIKAFRKTQ